MGNNTLVFEDRSLTVSVPGGFLIRDRKNGKDAPSAGEQQPDWSIQDGERHILFSVSRKHLNPLAAMMACSKDGIKGFEKRVHLSLQSRRYQFGEYITESLDGKKAYGFRFGCLGEDGEISCRTAVARDGGDLYYFSSSINTGADEEASSALEEIWKSIRWA